VVGGYTFCFYFHCNYLVIKYLSGYMVQKKEKSVTTLDILIMCYLLRIVTPGMQHKNYHPKNLLSLSDMI